MPTISTFGKGMFSNSLKCLSSVKHIKSLLCKSLYCCMRKLQCFEVVKIFDHMLFLAVSQFDNISRRKLIWIVFYGLVNHLGCYAIQFSNISV